MLFGGRLLLFPAALLARGCLLLLLVRCQVGGNDVPSAPDGCALDLPCPITLVIGLGASGTKSISDFFKINGFAAYHWESPGSSPSEREPWEEVIKHDMESNHSMLFAMCEKATEAAKETTRGVALSDFKTVEKASGFEETLRVLKLLDQTFHRREIVWNFRHPTKWATSMTHWDSDYKFANEGSRQKLLKYQTRRWLSSQCACFYHYGDRIGPAGDTAMLNLEKVDWNAFKKGYRDQTGCDAKGELPKSHHHPPKWTYPLDDANNELKSGDALAFFREHCKDYISSYEAKSAPDEAKSRQPRVASWPGFPMAEVPATPVSALLCFGVPLGVLAAIRSLHYF